MVAATRSVGIWVEPGCLRGREGADVYLALLPGS